MDKLTIGVVFGGVSPEHEVSIISSLQAAAAFDRSRFEPVPIYIGKDGRWYTGDDLLDIERYRDLNVLRREARRVALQPGDGGTLDIVEIGRGGFFHKPWQCRIDVLFLGLHGGAGEDGGVQGLCKALNIPFTGSDVLGSAIGIDKVVSKYLCRDAGTPIVDFVAFRESDWVRHEDTWLDRIEEELGYPVIVKPARLGSSIGIARAKDRASLDAAIEEALRYDDKIVVEDAVEPLREINCAVLGNPDEALPSVLEQPVKTEGEDLLTYQEKYMRGGGGKGKGPSPRRGSKQRSESSAGMASLDRIIPAPLDDEKTREIQDLAVRIFKLFECSGVARIDFMINDDTGKVYFNEINTIPGSFSFYLAVEPLREINCAVLGNPDEALPSVLEQPVKTEGEDLLTYQEKYMRGGGGKGKGPSPRRGSKQRSESSAGMASLDRIIPAPLDDEKTREIQDLAVRIFKLFECSGVARIDFMINDDTGKVYFNEINTIPGSFSFYLWEPTGIGFQELTTRMIELALERHRMSNGRIRSYDVNLLSQQSLQGLLGTKK